jgi:hypothetical protein
MAGWYYIESTTPTTNSAIYRQGRSKIKKEYPNSSIVSFNRPNHAQEIYKERRQIETAFRALKSSGFNMENAHLSDIERVDKLFAMVITAFTWAYIVGIYGHENLKQLKIKKHGRREKSLFKYGLGIIANILLNPQKNHKIEIFHFLSCT